MQLVSLDFYILTFILGFGAAVIVGKAAIQTIDQRWKYGSSSVS